jgi:hypothetical protein
MAHMPSLAIPVPGSPSGPISDIPTKLAHHAQCLPGSCQPEGPTLIPPIIQGKLHPRGSHSSEPAIGVLQSGYFLSWDLGLLFRQPCPVMNTQHGTLLRPLRQAKSGLVLGYLSSDPKGKAYSFWFSMCEATGQDIPKYWLYPCQWRTEGHRKATQPTRPRLLATFVERWRGVERGMGGR